MAIFQLRPVANTGHIQIPRSSGRRSSGNQEAETPKRPDYAGDGAPRGSDSEESCHLGRGGDADGVAVVMNSFLFRPINSVPHSFYATGRCAPACAHRLFSALRLFPQRLSSLHPVPRWHCTRSDGTSFLLSRKGQTTGGTQSQPTPESD